MKIIKIVYAAANENMGDTSARDCDLYRNWAKNEIKLEYPNIEVDIIDSDSANSKIMFDGPDSYEAEKLRGDIFDFMAQLWDRCPWDFTEQTRTVRKW